MIDVMFLWETLQTLITGLPLTLALAGISVVLGTVLSIGIALLAISGNRVLSGAAASYVFCIRGTPLLVQIFIIYYGLGQFRHTLQDWGVWWVFREPFWCAIMALTINTAAYSSEIIRGGLKAVPSGQIAAAHACGMSGLLLFRRIIFPIAARQALPGYGNEIILMVKATSLASVITMMEITGLAAKLISETFRALEVFVVAGSLYLLMTFLLTRLIGMVEYWLSPHLRDMPVGDRPLETSHA